MLQLLGHRFVSTLTMHAKNLEWVVGAPGTASLYFFLDFYNLCDDFEGIVY